MTKVNIFEVKARLSEYLDRAVSGEPIVICRHNKPVAELRPVVAALRNEPRPIGPVEGRPTFDIPPSFFEPLDENELQAWEGLSAPGDPAAHAFPPSVSDTATRVAESAPRADTKRRQTRKRRP